MIFIRSVFFCVFFFLPSLLIGSHSQLKQVVCLFCCFKSNNKVIMDYLDEFMCLFKLRFRKKKKKRGQGDIT